jgi:chromosome segregation ATPase
MSNIEEHINTLNTRLQALLKKYAALQKENVSLTNELQQLKTNEQSLLEKINFLEMQTGVLKASAGTMTQQEKTNFEKRINQYLRDIDKCIAILNN